MKYNILGRSGLRASEIGLGCEHLEGKSYDVIRQVIDVALGHGVNILDVFMSEPQVRFLTSAGRWKGGGTRC